MISPKSFFAAHAQSFRKSDGQALPLVLILLSLIAIATFSIAMNLLSDIDSLATREYNTYVEAQEQFKIQAAANGIVLNNRHLKRELMSLLHLTDSTLSSGFRISASALLWENSLPIPLPYDIFKGIRRDVPRVGTIAQRLLDGSLGYRPDLEATGQWKVHVLTMRQSLCRLACVDTGARILSGTRCTNAFVWDDECSITASQAPLIPHSRKTIPLGSVFPESFLNGNAFVYLEPMSPASTLTGKRHTEFSAGIAHPALCTVHSNGFSLPCTAERATAKKLRWLPDNLAFNAHWSLTFEKNEHL